ncbi:hypothetical protein SDRG_06743 [Saprolegnia diclina VS20]|uniref:Protein phosphatase n=1 Tax=Saprolegnia diclina (strain VS20) TaxID=1156394 RepID=T0RUC3_SAPDV|nr:hypothetical protein SDRG_06743 [Saprolegnia diclina VS20]EQC36003.1 hypothetical protein SDRG_06743 [Saprolegnia diclina VS20]|eukprot:XP_008610765.1 hypothetical protein SDRG_06743 [Saprolegnia diclina VS20]
MDGYKYLLAKMKASRGNQSRLGSFASVGCASYDFHGDDAVGYGPNYMVVADGVSGTQKASGVLARLLVAETLNGLEKLRRRALEEPIKTTDFRNQMALAIQEARHMTRRKGRFDSALTAVYLDASTSQLFVFNIGDCKCVLVRNGAVVFESDAIIYDFNVPAVVSTHNDIHYPSESVELQVATYMPGDICMVFSDGVHDNLYVDQVLRAIAAHPAHGTDIARATVRACRDTFAGSTDFIPFAVAAAGFCATAMEEMKTNDAISAEDFDAFEKKCAGLPGLDRPIFGKEKRVKNLAFYSASNLLTFAGKKLGKKDDISVCCGIIA